MIRREDASLHDEVEASTPGASAEADATEHGRAAGDARTADKRGPTLARVYQEELRVDGRFRWSVGGARPVCSQCRTEIPPSGTFHTVLVEAASDSPESDPGDLLEVFERRDLCEECFGRADRSTVFAFWKSALPAARGEVKKSVNVISLRAYFDRLIDSLSDGGHADAPIDNDGRDPESPLTLDRDQASDEDDEAAAESSDRAATPTTQQTLAYLLGLFLVRKRNLRWGDVVDGVLRLNCRATDRSYFLETPPLTEQELESGVRAFEELFG